ncbi:MAG: G-D-S-L family lipolytic protein [Saprospiraceae bacterium]|nr:G-D-S-L family lipolytic protein [Saprospiraceae bacterium]
MKNYNLILLLLSMFLTSLPEISSQDPTRFADDIQSYKEAPVEYEGRPIVFVGSSSIRMWSDINQRFQGFPILNRGFGGSQMSDLLYYLDDLVIQYKPEQVFIYEGDNDIASGKSNDEILKDAQEVVTRLLGAMPDVEVVFIAPKPSVKRWDMANQYMALNAALSKYAEATKQVRFADVWTPALGSDGKVRSDIFLDDNLHMNAQGYDIWEEVVRPILAE